MPTKQKTVTMYIINEDMWGMYYVTVNGYDMTNSRGGTRYFSTRASARKAIARHRGTTQH